MGSTISSPLNAMKPANSIANTSSGTMTTTASMNSSTPSMRRNNRRFGFGSPSMTGGKSRKQRKGSRKSRKGTTRRRR